MNRERAKELLPIIQAFAEGKEIQVRTNVVSHAGWVSLSDLSENPTWQEDCDYRIKPEPRTGWVRPNDLHDHINHLCEDSGCIKVVEVIE